MLQLAIPFYEYTQHQLEEEERNQTSLEMLIAKFSVHQG